MSCNTKTSVEANFSSVASTIATIEIATSLAYEYPESLATALEGLNDPAIVIPAVRYGIDNLIEAINTFYAEVIDTGEYDTVIAKDYPNLDNRLDQPTRLTYTELADFLDFISYPDTETFRRYCERYPQRVVKDLDRYYADKMSGESVSLCSLLDNPFAGIAGIVDSITSMTSNILNMIPAIAARLKSFAEMIKGVVDQVFQTMKGVVSNLAGTIQSVAQGISNIPAAFAGIASSISQKYAALQNLFSDINLTNIKEGIDKFVTKAVKQFEKILENPAVILHLLYMFCKTASFIEGALKNPVQSFQSMIGNIQHEQNVLMVKSAPRTQGAINAGRVVATDSSLASIRNQRTTSHNNAVTAAVADNPEDPATTNSKYVFQPQVMSHPDPNSWSNLSFAPSVINNSFWKSDKNVRMDAEFGGGTVNVKSLGLSVATGYYGCKIEVLEMLNEVGKMLGKKLTVNSAFRHPVYNQHLRNTGHGAAKNSMHMKGVALDVAMAGVNRATFCAAAHKIGFRGFGGYGNFIHVDTGAKRSWGRGNLPNGPWI